MGRKTKKQLDETLLRDRRRQVAEMLFEGTTAKEMAFIFRVDELKENNYSYLGAILRRKAKIMKSSGGENTN